MKICTFKNFLLGDEHVESNNEHMPIRSFVASLPAAKALHGQFINEGKAQFNIYGTNDFMQSQQSEIVDLLSNCGRLTISPLYNSQGNELVIKSTTIEHDPVKTLPNGKTQNGDYFISHVLGPARWWFGKTARDNEKDTVKGSSTSVDEDVMKKFDECASMILENWKLHEQDRAQGISEVYNKFIENPAETFSEECLDLMADEFMHLKENATESTNFRFEDFIDYLSQNNNNILFFNNKYTKDDVKKLIVQFCSIGSILELRSSQQRDRFRRTQSSNNAKILNFKKALEKVELETGLTYDELKGGINDALSHIQKFISYTVALNNLFKSLTQDPRANYKNVKYSPDEQQAQMQKAQIQSLYDKDAFFSKDLLDEAIKTINDSYACITAAHKALVDTKVYTAISICWKHYKFSSSNEKDEIKKLLNGMINATTSNAKAENVETATFLKYSKLGETVKQQINAYMQFVHNEDEENVDVDESFIEHEQSLRTSLANAIMPMVSYIEEYKQQLEIIETFFSNNTDTLKDLEVNTDKISDKLNSTTKQYDEYKATAKEIASSIITSNSSGTDSITKFDKFCTEIVPIVEDTIYSLFKSEDSDIFKKHVTPRDKNPLDVRTIIRPSLIRIRNVETGLANLRKNIEAISKQTGYDGQIRKFIPNFDSLSENAKGNIRVQYLTLFEHSKVNIYDRTDINVKDFKKDHEKTYQAPTLKYLKTSQRVDFLETAEATMPESVTFVIAFDDNEQHHQIEFSSDDETTVLPQAQA